MNFILERRIDKLGRIVIPKDIRKFLEIENGSTLTLRVDNGKIVIEKRKEH